MPRFRSRDRRRRSLRGAIGSSEHRAEARSAERSRGTAPALVTALLLPLLLLASGPSATGSPGGGPDGQRAKALRYVAMGDSYSAASGVLPLDLSQPDCIRSERNYPKVIAERTGVRLTDVTCGAAETGDFTESQYPDVDPQLDALSRKTDLVTMTIGGNDSNVFIGAIVTCGALGVISLGQGAPCKEQQGSSYVDTIRETTFPSIVKALRKVHAKAPHARVAILSYPWILPKRGGCYPQMPVAKGDVPYLRHLQAVLNDAVKRAAHRTGTVYVGLNRASNGHDACEEPGIRWVEPVLEGSNPVIVHPNALGERKMAAHAIQRLGLR